MVASVGHTGGVPGVTFLYSSDVLMIIWSAIIARVNMRLLQMGPGKRSRPQTETSSNGMSSL